MKHFYSLLLLLVNFYFVAAQSHTVTGKITSATTGESLPGVNVIEKGTTNGTVTDLSGNYKITVTSGDAVIEISYVGFLSEEIEVNGRTQIDVALVEDILEMDEVVVIGYGGTKKKDLTTAVATVSSESIEKSQSISVDKALQGKVAGVNVSANGGEPGSGVSVKIRGVGGIAGGNPLYIIDGVVVTSITNPADESFTGSGASNPLALINPNDIESISVLKDAAASAIYGSRGGNGVVIITTKSGKSGKPKINIRSSFGATMLSTEIETLSSSDFARFSNEARTNAQPDNPNIYYMFEDPDALPDRVDYLDEISRVGTKSDVQLSVSGGNETSNYFISGSYYNEEGIIINSDFERYTLRANTSSEIAKWLRFGNNLTLSQVTNNMANVGAIQAALNYHPVIPLYQMYNGEQHFGGISSGGEAWLGQLGNPVRALKLRHTVADRYRILGNLFLEFEPIPGLVYKPNLGLDYRFLNTHSFSPSYREVPIDTTAAPYSQNTNRQATYRELTERNLQMDHTLTYNTTLLNKHNIEFMGTYTAQIIEGNHTFVTRRGHLSNELMAANGNLASQIVGADQSPLQTLTYVSQLGRMSYNYDGKYYFSASLRRDGSSVFPPEYKYGIFASYSAAWRISDENFMAGLTGSALVKDIKLRASYGTSGVDGAIGGPPYFPTLDARYFYVIDQQFVTGISPSRYVNTSLRWEDVKMLDIGADVLLFNGKISFVADYFDKLQEGVIYRKTNMDLMGMRAGATLQFDGSIAVNGGAVRNKGWEFALDFRNQERRFKYNVGINFMAYTNIVEELETSIVSDNGNVYTYEGQPVNQFYGYIIDGIFQTQEEIDALESKVIAYDEDQEPIYDEDGNLVYNTVSYQSAQTAPGDYKFRDINGDGRITENDRTFTGSPHPDFIYGLHGSVSFKDFDISFSFQGVYGNEILNLNNVGLLATQDGLGNVRTEMLDRWTPENTDASQPRVHSEDPNNNQRISDRYVEDGSYLRMGQLELGYNLPTDNKFARSLSISGLRVYVSATNLFTLTNYSGFNPDIGTTAKAETSTRRGLGIDNSTYPYYKGLTFGINVNL